MSYQIGLFPSYICGDKGDEAPRIRAELQMKLRDRQTGDALILPFTFDQHKPEAVVEWLKSVLSHPKTLQVVNAWIQERGTGRDE